MELLDILVTVLIGAIMGIGVAALYAAYVYHKLKHRIEHLVEQAMAEAESEMVGLDVEVDNNVYFCYNSEDKQFVCQGATVVEIAQAFKNRFPGKTAYLAGGEPEVLAKFKEELSKLRLELDEASHSQ